LRPLDGPAEAGLPETMTRLSFCLLATFYPPWNFGGDGIHVQRLARALARRGHEVTVVCSPTVHRLLSREGVEEAAEDAATEDAGIHVVAIKDSLISLTGEYLMGRPLRARRQLDSVLERDFDVMHFHNPSLLGAPATLAMGKGIKLYTAHEQWLLCGSHLLWKRTGRVCESPPCWSCEVSHLRPPQLWRRTALLERSLAHLDALIAPSRASADLHRRFAPPVRLEVINHFAPEPPDRNAAAAVPAPERGRQYFLYAGRLEPIKDVSSLIEAFRDRADELVIAGNGGLQRRLRRAARGLPQVRFTGWLSEAQLDRLYRGARAVLIPTAGHEAFPLVAVEAMAHGTPVIARRFGALEEIIEDTGAGISYSSPAELGEALERINSDGNLGEELGRRGLEACRDRYSVEAHLRRYLGLISGLARERGDDDLAARAKAAMPELAGAGAGR
jgi:glycosyltransferase involved in cell wall biosynthesis